MDLGLAGARVLVTGASGGIGSATARLLAAEGARVAVHYHRNAERGQALADEVDGVAVGADLTDPEATAALLARSAEALGGLDHLVANAGVWPSEPQPLWELPFERWRATIDANLTATVLPIREFLALLAREGRADDAPAPAIVMTGSTAGSFGEAGHSDYAAAKGAIASGLLRSLKNEVGALHPDARVNVVAPGWTVSEMTAATLDAATVARVTATMPLAKVATTDDVAAAIAWLLSPVAAGHVTGEVVTVAGGMEGRMLRDPGR